MQAGSDSWGSETPFPCLLMPIPAHCDLEENTTPGCRLQAKKRGVRHRRATTLNLGTCALLMLRATLADPAGRRRRRTARDSCLTRELEGNTGAHETERRGSRENERGFVFLFLHQITSASKQHHHRCLLPQTGQAKPLASAAPGPNARSFSIRELRIFEPLDPRAPAPPPGNLPEQAAVAAGMRRLCGRGS